MAKKLVRFLIVLMAMSAARAWAIGPDESFIKTRSFSIPINITGGQKEKISEIELFVSTDEGKTWNKTSVIPPEKGGFSYTAATDGMYWFKVCTVDKAGNREPNDIYKQGRVEKIFVDTLPPTLRIVKAERQGENIVVFWEMQELNPDLNSFKLEYRAVDGFWFPVTVTPALVGQQSFRSPHNGPVKVRMTVGDLAGNQAPVEAEVAGRADDIASNLTTTSMQVPSGGQTGSAMPDPTFPAVTPTPQPAAPQPAYTAPSQPMSTVPQTNSPAPPVPNGYGAVVPSMATTNQFSSPPVSHGQVGASGSGGGSGYSANSGGQNDTYRSGNANGNSPAPPAINSSLPPAPPSLAMQQTSYAAAPAAWQQNNTQSQSGNIRQAEVRNSGERNWGPPATRSPGGIGLPPGNPPGFVATRWINNLQTTVANSTRITLDYRVDRVGPSGVGAVDLYLTEDEGRTWRRYKEEQDAQPPMVVDLPGEGVFGLKLVVTSKAGLCRRPPQDGDLPEMRVEVDMTPPVVKLFRPEPHNQRRDAIVLTWQASDERNLATSPITLQWAERPDGPWQTIASDLTNSGRYIWTVGRIPARVYLRVVARDMAGNIGFDETAEPVTVDLTEPEATIIRISSGSKQP
jgi:hypothetical protein